MKKLIEFENTFKSMWKTTKEKNISKNDVEKEIKGVRIKNTKN